MLMLVISLAASAALAPATPRQPSSPAPPPLAGTLARNETMRREPFTDARAVVTLRARTTVSIRERRGPWYRVSSGTRTGWVRMLAVRTTPSTPAPRAAAAETGRSATGGLVSTTGIRALDAGALRTAIFSETESARLEALAVTPDMAHAFATHRGLTARPIPYLPDPRAANPSSSRAPRR